MYIYTYKYICIYTHAVAKSVEHRRPMQKVETSSPSQVKLMTYKRARELREQENKRTRKEESKRA